VRHRRLIGWFTRWFGYFLLDAVRRLGAYTLAAGGRKGRLDLNATAVRAATESVARWRAYSIHIAATTRHARTWEDFLAQHYADPAKVSLHEARRRFEQQPRVLAMLAYAGAHTLDPYELAAYQAGEATYAGLHWRIALIGDALITTDGRLMEPPATPSQTGSDSSTRRAGTCAVFAPTPGYAPSPSPDHPTASERPVTAARCDRSSAYPQTPYPGRRYRRVPHRSRAAPHRSLDRRRVA
jgi:hypothetical protein